MYFLNLMESILLQKHKMGLSFPSSGGSWTQICLLGPGVLQWTRTKEAVFLSGPLGGKFPLLSFGFLPPNNNKFVFIFWMIFTLENNAWWAGIKFYKKKTFVFQALPFRMVGNDICISTIQCNALVNFMKLAVLKCVLKLWSGWWYHFQAHLWFLLCAMCWCCSIAGAHGQIARVSSNLLLWEKSWLQWNTFWLRFINLNK